MPEKHKTTHHHKQKTLNLLSHFATSSGRTLSGEPLRSGPSEEAPVNPGHGEVAAKSRKISMFLSLLSSPILGDSGQPVLKVKHVDGKRAQ